MTTPEDPGAPVPVVRYYQLPGGAFSKRTYNGYADEEPEPVEGAVEVSAEEYEAGLAAIEAHNAELAAEEAAAARVVAKAEYEEMIENGFPESMARRMSGYDPDEDES